MSEMNSYTEQPGSGPNPDLYVYEIDGDTLMIWSGEKGSPAYYKGQFTEGGNTLTGNWVYPGGDGYEAIATRQKKRERKKE